MARAAPRRPAAPARRASRAAAGPLPAWRSRFLLFGLFCGFAALAARAVYLQGGFATEDLQHKQDQRVVRNVAETPPRGTIFDRNQGVLAQEVDARAVAINPGQFDADARQQAQLAGMLRIPLGDLRHDAGANRDFIYLRHQLEPDVAQRVEEMNLHGVQVLHEPRRVYPEGSVTAQFLGFDDLNGRGQEGVEHALNAMLAGAPGLHRVTKDNLHRVVDGVWVREPVRGQDVVLAMDQKIQYIAHVAVEQAAHRNNARAASAVVIDTRTGELLAMANWPNFDPSHREHLAPDLVRNRAITDTFEPGSTLKPFSIATALERGVVRPDTVIDTSPGHIVVGGRTISDTHVHGALTVEQVIAKSSNVGTTRIALQMPAQAIWDTLDAVGFGHTPQVAGLTGATTGRLRPAGTWKPVEQATIAYGYGISVSLLQLAHAYLAFARDGDIVPISVLKLDQPPAPQQVFSPQTAARMRAMLEMAVGSEGTAQAARIEGYRVAGKTGTARKLHNGQYVQSYVSSFVGFAPAVDPRIVVAVLVDDPKAGRFYGGDVAAPAFNQIATGALRVLQVPPDAATAKLAQSGATGG